MVDGVNGVIITNEILKLQLNLLNQNKFIMQFGSLSNRQAIDKRFKQLRAVSRQELLSQIYGKSNNRYNSSTVQQQLTETFSALLHNYDFNKENQIIKQIGQLFSINLQNIQKMETKDRQKYIYEKILCQIQQNFKIIDKSKEQSNSKIYSKSAENQQNHFEWLGVQSKYTELRPIFQEILLEKVKLFDNQLTQLTIIPQSFLCSKMQLPTTARQGQEDKAFSAKSKTLEVTRRLKKAQSSIQSQFCNVKIRDKSNFILQKWTQNEEQQFLSKKAEFRSNLKINNIPVLFQFVKKYTQTVKARDNIYHKWQHRQKLGITPQQLRYLCATSLFLNNSLAKSQKQRIKRNVQIAGSQLISKLETNIAQKIIETYHQLMKKVSDLRAKYYEELTQQRKKQQKIGSKVEQFHKQHHKKRQLFIKYKQMFVRIVNSERMKIRLNTKAYKWIELFIHNLKKKVNKSVKKNRSQPVFNRIATRPQQNTILFKLKAKFPSSKIIKREDQYSHRLKYQTYIQSQRFQYEKSFEKSITDINKIKLNKTHKKTFYKQLTGGPKTNPKYIIVDLSKKKVYLSSPNLMKYIIAIQAKWRSVFERKKFISQIQQVREFNKHKFQEQIQSLKRIYPLEKKINLKMIENRLRRVNMQISNIIKPYLRVIRRPINHFTSFCSNNLSLSEIKIKYARNGRIRLNEFVKMVESNQYSLLVKSGIVVTSKQINENNMQKGANAVWWAVQHSNLELIRKFLEGGGDPNSKDQEDNTCLHIAVRNGDMQIIFILLDYGADLNKKNNKRVTSLYHATSKMLKLLGLQEGTVTGERDNNSMFYRRNNNIDDFYNDHC